AGIVTLYGYDLAGRLSKTVQNASQPSYDNSYTTGDPSLSAYQGGRDPAQDLVTTSQYDPAGNLVKTTDPLGHVTLTGYDRLSRPIKTVRSASQPAYNLAADPTLSQYVPSGASDQDQVDSSQYDALGRVTRSQDAAGNWTLFGYDGLGRQIRAIRAASQS